MVSRACAICGALFEVKYPSSERRYCDRKECRGASRRGQSRPSLWRRETVACVVCGKEFERGGHFVKGGTRKSGRQVTCSAECARRSRYRHGRTCNVLSVEQAAYLAGLWDADGSFVIHGRYDGSESLGFRAQIGVTKSIIIDWVAEATGLGYRALRRRSNPKHAQVYNWLVNGDGAETFTRQLIPYLILKKPQAELGVEFQERLRTPALKADRAWQAEYRDRMREMNRRGV